jgi:hypothetical protein
MTLLASKVMPAGCKRPFLRVLVASTRHMVHLFKKVAFTLGAWPEMLHNPCCSACLLLYFSIKLRAPLIAAPLLRCTPIKDIGGMVASNPFAINPVHALLCPAVITGSS